MVADQAHRSTCRTLGLSDCYMGMDREQTSHRLDQMAPRRASQANLTRDTAWAELGGAFAGYLLFCRLRYYMHSEKEERTSSMQEGVCKCIACCLICCSSMRGQKAQILDAEEPEKPPKVGHLSAQHVRNSPGLIRQTGEISDQERVSWSRLSPAAFAWVGCRTN